jgi:D-arabinose 1-dehydrogenase-like Zn-dependent alcohol dehydrogenase
MDVSNDRLLKQLSGVVIPGTRRNTTRSMPLEEPAYGQVRVRLEGCGVCASNLTPWAGPDWMQFPTEPGGLGHEGWGRIDALGTGVDGLEGRRPRRCLKLPCICHP